MVHCREFRHHRVPYNGRIKLASYYIFHNVRIPIKAAQITAALRWHAGVLEPTTGIKPADISAHSLRAGGTMALLAGRCDSNVIKLLARWHSDARMCYLHQQSLPIFQKLASYPFLPDKWVPSSVSTVV